MAFWNRKQLLPAAMLPTPSMPIDFNQALEMVLVNAVKSQAETAAAIGQSITQQLQAVAEIQQAVFSQRRIRNTARKRAQAAVRGQGGRFKRSMCRLCENPGISNPTIEEIRAHATHGDSPIMSYRQEGGAVVIDVPERVVQTNSKGEQVIECEDCASGKEHSHVLNS